MTKEEFLQSIPNRIEHVTYGRGELVVVLDLPNEKAACYKHEDQPPSYKTYGTSWQEVYNDMAWLLKRRNQLQ